MNIIEFKDVSRVYTNGEHEQRALDHVSLSLKEGKFIVVLGPSGAGKSTMLNLLGGLDSPSEGTITVDGRDISTLTPNELADYRASKVGFVFQSYNLIPTLTVIENIALVKDIAPDPLSSHDMLAAVGLADLGALRRRAAARVHRAGAGEKSEDSPVRRADRRAGFRDRRDGAETPSQDGAGDGEDDRHRDAQPEYRENGGCRDPREKRKSGVPHGGEPSALCRGGGLVRCLRKSFCAPFSGIRRSFCR